MNAAISTPGPASRLSMRPLAKFVLVALLAGIVGLSMRLWPQWRHNPDLSHGLFMPLIFAALLYESRSGTQRYVRTTFANRILVGVLLCAGLLALIAAGFYAASVDWSHALVNLMLTLALVFFLGASLMVFARDDIRAVPFNWPAIVAIGLWVLTAPIPPGTYSRLTLGLQLWVSEAVVRTLHLLGIAAVRYGNVIELGNATVGVEEACSGIRSLVSCMFAGLFFSATLVRHPWRRAVIISLAAPLALVMNFLRSLALTLLANRGVDISGSWHDLTGFAVLGITAALLGVLALALDRGTKRAASVPPPSVTASRTPALWALAGGTVCAAALIVFFAANTRPSIREHVPVPNLMGLLPDGPAGWHVKTTDLFEFRGTLQTEHLAQRNYVRPTDPSAEIIIYVAYWRAGQAPVSLVASHTPDACWPGSGWTALPVPQPRARLLTGARALPDAEHRVFQGGNRAQHVWYWHLYDGRPILYRDPYSPIELLSLAWRFGFRRGGDQMFVRVSSNRPWSDIANEPLLADFFDRIRGLGL